MSDNATKLNSIDDIMTAIEQNGIKFVDFRCTDTKGKEQHVTIPASRFDEEIFENGHPFDGSSFSG